MFESWFKKYRIIKMNEKFIPQLVVGGRWEGIQENLSNTWYLVQHQFEYCGHLTLQEAENTIKSYKNIKFVEVVKYL